MVKNYTDKELLDKVQEIKNFKGIPNDYWLLGVRSKEDITDVFDDKIYVYLGTTFKAVLKATTNPGAVYLKGRFKKYNKEGVAVLKSDYWHYDCWKFGLHRGKMEALRQDKDMPYYRDGNLNDKSEEIGNLYTGKIGLNFHGSTYRKGADIKREEIGFWSAGCQVAADNLVYREVIKIFKESNQKQFTYCLINEF
tara:strand:+ start:283 stop:867 length:585 start_codon:yes stop_codon:yes gene_type:complete